MTCTHLLDFMRRKAISNGNDVVVMRGKEPITLSQLFRDKDIDFETLSVSQLDMRMREHMFFRFDHFNRAIAPKADHELRAVFLKSRNHIGGTYFADVLKEVSHRAGRGAGVTAMEPRVSVYGQQRSEWSSLAKWWKATGLNALPNMKWMVQFPRLFTLFAKSGSVKTFEEFLHNCGRVD